MKEPSAGNITNPAKPRTWEDHRSLMFWIACDAIRHHIKMSEYRQNAKERGLI